MSKDAARNLVAALASVYREAEEARLANYERLKLESALRASPICAGQTVWLLFLEPISTENADNHPGYVTLAGQVRDTREIAYEVFISGSVRICERVELYLQREEAELPAQAQNAVIARRLAEWHDGALN